MQSLNKASTGRSIGKFHQSATRLAQESHNTITQPNRCKLRKMKDALNLEFYSSMSLFFCFFGFWNLCIVVYWPWKCVCILDLLWFPFTDIILTLRRKKKSIFLLARQIFSIGFLQCIKYEKMHRFVNIKEITFYHSHLIYEHDRHATKTLE